MSNGGGRQLRSRDARGRGATIDELLDRAVAAINRGDRVAATALAEQVLTADEGNADAEDLLAGLGGDGEIRRLTILFADLVDSTVLSTRVEPETYRVLVGRYREQVLRVVDRYEGHVASTKGDGLLTVFGHPTAHENDVRRAVQAGLEITREVAALGEAAQRRFGVDLKVRVGVHRGLVYLDTAQDDVYGLAANLAARVSALASPGTVVVSDAVEPLVRRNFELETRPSAAVKGVEGLVAHHQVLGERADKAMRGRGLMVGRDRELDRLEKYWSRAQSATLTRPGVVFRGDPGIGKSRLAAAAAEVVEASGRPVLELIGSPFHTDAGLHPVRTLLERRCGIERSTESGERLRLLEAELAAVGLDPITAVPLLAPVLGIATEHGYEPVAAEGRKLYELISQAVQQYLLACMGSAAALLVAEDVHWFDPSTMEVLRALLDAGDGRLLVVATGRPGGWLPAGWPVKVVDLKPLTDEQTDALILALNPTVTADQRVALAGRCDGVPFYIEQVVAGLGTDASGVPEMLYEPLLARLRATPNVLPVVQAAATIGRHVERNVLLAAVTLDEAAVDDVIDELEDASVLEPWATDGWRFRHELLREVAAELAPPSVRRQLHARVADALVGGVDGEPDWRLVAGHYERAERFHEAVSAYQQASAEARRRGAFNEARAYLSIALTQLDRVMAGAERDRREITVRLERGFLAATAEGGSSPAVAADFERCLTLGGTDLHDDELFATLVALLGYCASRADLRRLVQVLESLSAGPQEGRPWFRPVIEACFGIAAWLRGEFDVARAHLECATAGRDTADHREIDAVWFIALDPIAGAHIHLALTHLVQGDLPGAEAAVARTVRRSDELALPQGPYSLAYGRMVEIWICMEAGELDHAAQLVADLLSQAERDDFDAFRLFGLTQRSTLKALTVIGADVVDPTKLSARLKSMTTLVDIWRAAEMNIYLTFYDGVIGRLLTATGRLEEARRRFDTALQLATDTEMHFYDAELLRLRAHTHTDPAARRADLDAARELAGRQGASLFELRAALDDFDFRGEPARARLVDVASRFPPNSPLPEFARAKAVVWGTNPTAG